MQAVGWSTNHFLTDFGVLLTKACYVLTETCYYCLVQQSRWHEFILMFAVYLHILHIGILIYHGLCTIFVYFISQNVGSPWFPRIPVRKVDDFGGWTFSTFIVINKLNCTNICIVATNRDRGRATLKFMILWGCY